MQKIILWSFTLSTFIGIANARTTFITDYDWEESLPTTTSSAGNPDKPTSCAEKCSGYDLITLSCEEGQSLEDCPVDGCHYYKRCIPN